MAAKRRGLQEKKERKLKITEIYKEEKLAKLQTITWEKITPLIYTKLVQQRPKSMFPKAEVRSTATENCNIRFLNMVENFGVPTFPEVPKEPREDSGADFGIGKVRPWELGIPKSFDMCDACSLEADGIPETLGPGTVKEKVVCIYRQVTGARAIVEVVCKSLK